MGISSSISGATSGSAVGIEVQKKAQDIQAQQVLKVLDSATKSSSEIQQVTAQKTGIGSNLNISA